MKSVKPIKRRTRPILFSLALALTVTTGAAGFVLMMRTSGEIVYQLLTFLYGVTEMLEKEMIDLACASIQ